MENTSEYVIGFITASTPEEAEKIANMLVRNRLAACCTIIRGAVSIYSWENKVEKSEECLIMAKTKRKLFGDLINYVRKIHSYQVPEIVCVEISEGFGGYLRWIDENTQMDVHQIEI